MDSTSFGQGCDILIRGVGILDFEDRCDFFPGRAEPAGTRRELVRNRTMQEAEIVAGNRGVHMMLGVVVHVPVQKLNNRVYGERPTAEPEIRHVVLQTDVLRVVAEKEEPASVEREKAR